MGVPNPIDLSDLSITSSPPSLHWRAAVEALHAENRSADLSDEGLARAGRAFEHVLNCPVTSLAELSEKLLVMNSNAGFVEANMDVLIRDLDNLGASEASGEIPSQGDVPPIGPRLSRSFAAALEGLKASQALLSRDDLDEETDRKNEDDFYERRCRLLIRQAETPAELKAKLDLVWDQDLTNWNAWDMVRSAIECDLARLERHEPSRAMWVAFQQWRATNLAHQRGDEGASEIHSKALLALMSTPSATAGDFILKSYVDLLGRLGGSLDGNLFDPNTTELDDEALYDAAYLRTLYDDLDATDLGACLLALGRTHFNPRTWLERARALGIGIAVIGTNSDKPVVETQPREQSDPRLARDQGRLLRLLATDSHRVNQLAEFIEREVAACDDAKQEAA